MLVFRYIYAKKRNFQQTDIIEHILSKTINNLNKLLDIIM